MALIDVTISYTVTEDAETTISVDIPENISRIEANRIIETAVEDEDFGSGDIEVIGYIPDDDFERLYPREKETLKTPEDTPK